ncbi:MAG TPA: polysaccharide deacetylase family protein [Thermoleophilaceae bacterium]|jgi:peptidoglycan/xylan/chitin deacetylase (PgdA/CDA1 family)
MPSFREFKETLELWRRFPALERGEAGGGKVALTFDDGPDPDATPAVLDALDAIGAHATFFMLGEQLMKHQDIGREVVRRGHEVALHGFGHERHEDLTPQGARDDLARGLGALEAATGRHPRFYRPPYGRFSEHSYEACGKLRMEPVYWTGWGSDWEPIPPARIAELCARDLTDGAILLLHDSPRYADRESAQPTAEALAPLAERALAAELRLVTLGEVAT